VYPERFGHALGLAVAAARAAPPTSSRSAPAPPDVSWAALLFGDPVDDFWEDVVISGVLLLRQYSLLLYLLALCCCVLSPSHGHCNAFEC